MRHVVKILLGLEHQRTGVVDVQKILQVVEHVGPAQGVHVRVSHGDAVALGQRKHQLGLQRALNVHVQLGLGHLAQQVGQAPGRNGFDFEHGISHGVFS